MYYSYARLGSNDLGFVRLSGRGLGNLLFPWARFIVATRKYRLTPIEPTWFQIKAGPFLRCAPDKRTYHNLFNHPAGQISGWRKIRLLHTFPWLPEARLRQELSPQDPPHVVVFQGMDGHFDQILTHHRLVRQELLALTRDEHKRGLAFDFRKSVSLHVRLDDFLRARPSGHPGNINIRTPAAWFVQSVQQIRRQLGAELPVYVFSDGKDAELAEILRLPRTRRITFGSSIADILAMTNANVLIASGSTFSMWSSYLGRMPVIWRKGDLEQRLYHERPEAEVELDYGESLPDSFLTMVAR